MRSQLTTLTLMASLALLGSLGCIKKGDLIPAKRPEKLLVQADAAATLNPGPDGEPMSVVVHVYQLKDKNDFQKLTFDVASSGRADNELFPQDFISKKEVILIPGGRLPETLDLQATTKYVGLVGLFRKPDTFAWRKLVTVDTLLARLEQIKAASAKDPKLPVPPPAPLLTFKAEHCYLDLVDLKAEPLAGQPEGAKPSCGAPPVKPAEPAPKAEAPKPEPTPKPEPAKPQPTKSGSSKSAGSQRPR